MFEVLHVVYLQSGLVIVLFNFMIPSNAKKMPNSKVSKLKLSHAIFLIHGREYDNSNVYYYLKTTDRN